MNTPSSPKPGYAFSRGSLSASGYNGTSGSGLDTVSSFNANSGHSQSWTLDAVGNQSSVVTDGTTRNNTLDGQNEMTGFGASTLVFDNNGNTTTDDQGHTLVYDAWNRLVAVKNGGSTLVAYGYDANGNRVTRAAGGTTTHFYDSAAGQVLEERQGSTVTNQYVWSLAYLNTPVLRDDNSSGGSYGRSGSGLGWRIYVQEDANFNVTALTDTSGNVLQRFVYTPYGQVTVIGSTTAWASTSDSYSWVYTFQGGRYDATSGMVHFGAREYSPTLARWVQQDPAGYVDGGNRYRPMRTNPLRHRDPSGLSATSKPSSPPGSDPIYEDPLDVTEGKGKGFDTNAVGSSRWGSTDLHDLKIHQHLLVAPDASPELQGLLDLFNELALLHEQDVQRRFNTINSDPCLTEGQREQAKRDLGNINVSKYERDILKQMDELFIAILQIADTPDAQDEIQYLQGKIDHLGKLNAAATQPSTAQ